MIDVEEEIIRDALIAVPKKKWEYACRCREIVEKIKTRLYVDTGQTNYITDYDLKKIIEETK